MKRSTKSVFDNEAALCAAFIAALPAGWTAYPETAGFDIVLLREADGAQIGVEAKMSLNAKVLLQAIEGMHYSREAGRRGPDFRAALVPYGAAGSEMKVIASRLGVTVIECKAQNTQDQEIGLLIDNGWSADGAWRQVMLDWKPFTPDLPAYGERKRWREEWIDHCPMDRCHLPEYVPDVVAGASGPSSLSEWKVKAIKICILLEKQGFVTIADFKHLEIDRRRWLEMRWLRLTDDRGRYVAGIRPLDLRTSHPINYRQIEADFEKWRPLEPMQVQPELL